jgi:hypothetical protein
VTEPRIQVDLTEVRKALENLGEKAGPRAVADTLTQVAFQARTAVLTALPFYISKPIPFTQSNKAVPVNKASYKAAQIEAEVFFAERQSEYLGLAVFGGGRGPEDQAYTKAGVLVPTASTKLDRFGNFPGGPLKWLADVGDDEERYQIGIRGRPTYAIWDRGKSGNDFTLIAVFKRAVKYEEQFPFFDLVDNIVQRNIEEVFAEKINKELEKPF